MDKAESYKIAAVVVTFNRLSLLKQCISSLRNQTRKLDEIIVVNNSSTDGTSEWLTQRKNLTIINQKNSGSAGGQYTGIKAAFEKGYDWIWCLDHDVIPNTNALEKLLNAEEIEHKDTGFLSSLILDKRKDISYINVPYIRNFEEVLDAVSKNKSIPIISSSFGSVLFSAKAIEKVGFPFIDFFIWGDDVEYTMRIIQNDYFGYLILPSLGTHLQEENFRFPFNSMDVKNIKTKYAIRNSFFVIRFRNKILYQSHIRGILGCLNFYFILIRQRLKYKGKFDFKYFLLVSYNFLISFFRPITKEKNN